MANYAMRIDGNNKDTQYAECPITGLTAGNWYHYYYLNIDTSSNNFTALINSAPNDNTSKILDLGWVPDETVHGGYFQAPGSTVYAVIGDGLSVTGGTYEIVDDFVLKEAPNFIPIYEDSTDPFRDDSLVTKYMFNNDATDIMGVQDGTEVNVTYTEGKLNECLSLDGTGHVDAGTWDLWETPWSLSVWINSERAVGDFVTGVIIDFTTSIGGFTLADGHAADPGIDTLTVYADGAWRDTGINVRDNKWHHIVVTNTPSSVTVYVDNKQLYKVAVNNLSSPGGVCHIGEYYDETNGAFIGGIDQFEFYNKVLNTDEINSLFYTFNI